MSFRLSPFRNRLSIVRHAVISMSLHSALTVIWIGHEHPCYALLRLVKGMLLPQAMLPLLPDLWPSLAKAALAADGNSLAAWLRLSMVCRTWRESLAGAHRLALPSSLRSSSMLSKPNGCLPVAIPAVLRHTAGTSQLADGRARCAPEPSNSSLIAVHVKCQSVSRCHCYRAIFHRPCSTCRRSSGGGAPCADDARAAAVVAYDAHALAECGLPHR